MASTLTLEKLVVCGPHSAAKTGEVCGEINMWASVAFPWPLKKRSWPQPRMEMGHPARFGKRLIDYLPDLRNMAPRGGHWRDT